MVKMKLMTKEIQKKAQKQYLRGTDMDQDIVAKFFDPTGEWQWFLMNQDPKDPDYLWGIVKGFEVEMGSFSLSELEAIKRPYGLGIERDRFFKPMKAQDVYNKLNKGIYV